MQNRIVTALADRLRASIPVSKSRLETLGLLIAGAIGARTVNLGHIATERGGRVKPASTYRRLQRFFQFFRLAPDWAAPLLAATLGTERWTLVLDRTNWKIGRTEVNYLVLAAVTRRKRVPLLWTLLPHGGAARMPTASRSCAAIWRASPPIPSASCWETASSSGLSGSNSSTTTTSLS
jgi:hypothetical protein